MAAGAEGQINPKAMDKCSNARTPHCYMLGCSLSVVIGLLVWTDAVCSSAPYKFNIDRNVKVKVICNMLSAEATLNVVGRCWGVATCMLLMSTLLGEICDIYGKG